MEQKAGSSSSAAVADVAAAVDDSFHEAYDGERVGASQDHPVLVVLGDDLILVRGDARVVTPTVPALFHRIKAVAHAPVAVVVLHNGCASKPLDERSRQRLRSLVVATNHLAEFFRGASTDATERSIVSNLLGILARTSSYVETTLTAGEFDRDGFQAFASAVGPMLLQSTQDATSAQLRALHEAATRIIGSLSTRDGALLEVVVAGAHQARARNLAMQYFQKLFRESPAEEWRVSYAENAQSVEDALAQVSTRLLDRAIARVLFGDERRLQRDVLGDAAQEQLAHLELTVAR